MRPVMTEEKPSPDADEVSVDSPESGPGTSDETEPAGIKAEAGERAGASDVPEPSPESAAPRSGDRSVPWVDRWWIWALGGLAFAAFIALLHFTS